jgi:phosphotransferase system HPr (HPr) family protein
VRSEDVPHAQLAVRNPSGLHARPAAIFVETARRFPADVRVANLSRNPDKVASGRSLLGILGLGVSQGHTIKIEARGVDALRALEALRAVVESDAGDSIAPGGQG